MWVLNFIIMRKIIKIVYHNKEYKLQQHGNWIDLATAKDTVLKYNQLKLISLGVSMQLPKHYEALIIPRSSTFKFHRIFMANSVGLIDTEYSGMHDVWKFPAITFNKEIAIPKNTRIAQFKIVLSMNAPWWAKILNLFVKFKFKEIDLLVNKNRGGIGSTGN
jgi:dUTP pyrophosphatase